MSSSTICRKGWFEDMRLAHAILVNCIRACCIWQFQMISSRYHLLAYFPFRTFCNVCMEILVLLSLYYLQSIHHSFLSHRSRWAFSFCSDGYVYSGRCTFPWRTSKQVRVNSQLPISRLPNISPQNYHCSKNTAVFETELQAPPSFPTFWLPSSDICELSMMLQEWVRSI